jgi:hypothetical protein
MGWVLCPPSFLAQSHIARLLRDYVAKAGPLAVQLMALAASDATLQTAVRAARMGSAAVPVTCDLLPVWLWTGLYSPSLLGTVSFMEGCDGEGRGTRVHRLPGGCRGRSLVSRRASAERWIWGCGMYALQPSLCTAAAPASSFGISTITARTTVRRPAASEGRTGAGSLGGRTSR